MNALNETLRPGAAADRGSPAFGLSDSAADLAPHLLRIVRRALRSGGKTPMAQAIRSAVDQAEPAHGGDSDGGDDSRVRQVAGRLTALLAPRLAGAGVDRHRETVRA